MNEDREMPHRNGGMEEWKGGMLEEWNDGIPSASKQSSHSPACVFFEANMGMEGWNIGIME